MRKIIVLIGLASVSFLSAQQNFFNVPSTDITAPKKLFFQQQVNFFKEGIGSNTTFSYGLGKSMEVGVNLLGIYYNYTKNKIAFDDHEVPYAPVLAVNFLKLFSLNHSLKMGVGTQIAMNRIGKTALYIYNNLSHHIESTKTKIVGGLYYTSDGFFGEQTRGFAESGFFKNIGFQAGIEQNIWNEKWLFQADFISGKHYLGNVVIGGAYCIDKNWVASAGWQIGLPDSKASNGFVLEMTYIPQSSPKH